MANHRGKLAILGRFTVAVIAGTILGNAFALFAALGIDASYSHEVTGGDWQLNTPNVIYAAIMGFLVGLFAGTIAKTRGLLIGAVTQFFPLTFVIALSIYFNRPDVLSSFQVKPAVWTWIGLLPAIIGGHLGERLINDEETIQLLKSVGWHWSWVWIVVLTSLSCIAGSIRYLIAYIALGWQLLFIPRLWLAATLGLPLVSVLLYASYSVPASGTIILIGLVARRHDPHAENRHMGLKLFAIALGIPTATFILWYVNNRIISYLASQGLWLP